METVIVVAGVVLMWVSVMLLTGWVGGIADRVAKLEKAATSDRATAHESVIDVWEKLRGKPKGWEPPKPQLSIGTPVVDNATGEVIGEVTGVTRTSEGQVIAHMKVPRLGEGGEDK